MRNLKFQIRHGHKLSENYSAQTKEVLCRMLDQGYKSGDLRQLQKRQRKQPRIRLSRKLQLGLQKKQQRQPRIRPKLTRKLLPRLRKKLSRSWRF